MSPVRAILLIRLLGYYLMRLPLSEIAPYADISVFLYV